MTQRSRARIVLLALVACAGLTGSAAAQAVRGTLLGTVHDAQGAPVPGATVTATETQTNASRSVVTNQSGNYVFANLKDGLYRVETGLSGFKRFSRDGVDVKVNSTVRVDVVLEVGAMEETVEVVRETPPLQTDRADTGRTIEGRQVTELPLGAGRNFQGMWATVPGTVTMTRPHSQFFNPQDSQETKFNGQSRLSNNVQVDGLDNNHKTGLLTVLIPSAEAIDSLNVSTSNFDAEFGRAGGSVTTVVLKSGTNQLKGTAFYFGNSEASQARNFFASATSVKPETKYQQFGATLGGPVVRDKIFFFADYQRTVDNLGQLRRVVIPPSEWRNGNFSTAGTTIYDPATGNPDGTGRLPFPGNVIPANRISAVARNILGLLPQPNISGVAPGQVNYELPTSEREKTTNAFNVKLNFNPGVSDQISARFSYQRPEIFVPGTFGELGGAGADFAGTGYQNTYSTALTWTRTLSSTLITEWRAGYMKYHNEALSTGEGLNTSTEVGIPGANYDAFSSGLSRIVLQNGFTEPTLGFAASLPWDRGEETYSLAGMVTKIAGNHTIKAGTELRHNEDFLLQIQDAGGVRGEFRFNGARTATPSDTRAQAGLANAFAAFLLDAPSLIQRDVKVIDRPGTKHSSVFAFVQDKWQVSPKLTVDLGLRWEYYTPLRGIADQGGLSNYDLTTNTVRIAGYGSVPQAIGVESTWTNFAPRLGLSYRFDDATVARAGFGTTIIPFPDNRYAYNFPVKQTNQFNPVNGFAPAGRMASGFGPPDFFAIPQSGVVDANIAQLRNAQLFHVQPDLKEAKLHTWNVALQRQLPWNLVGEVAYVGNVGRGILLADYNLNAGMALGAENAGRPFFQQFGRTANVLSWFESDTSYHSMQVKLDRRFRGGFLLNTSYTLARAINYQDETAGTFTPAEPERMRGRAGFDRTHAFAGSFIWDMPFLRGSDSALGRIVGGWQLSGIFTAYSGIPIDFRASDATLRAPGNVQRPNVSGDPEVLGDIGPGKLFFDTSVFSAPAQNTWGNMKRNDSINGPGFWNVDLSVAKRFRLSDRFTAELRADAFNAFNHANFANPNATFGQATFGQVTATNGSYAPRLVRFGARLMF